MKHTVSVLWKPWGAPSPEFPFEITGKARVKSHEPISRIEAAEAIMRGMSTKAIEITKPPRLAGVYRMEQEPIPHAVLVPEEELTLASAA